MDKNKIGYVVAAMILVIVMGNISTAATVELVNPGELPAQLPENKPVNFTIKIENYAAAKNVTIDTSLVMEGNNPVYDFGDLNPALSEYRYKQTITLDTALLPSKEFKVTISGKAPLVETERIKDTDIVITRFGEEKKNYYDVSVDNKFVTSDSFELIIKTKEEFTETIKKISWKELDELKQDLNKIFDSGLTMEAQKMADGMVNIRAPDNLLLFGLIKIENNLWLNIAVIVFALIGGIIGFRFGRDKGSNPDD
ncbi:MAG: hypothetical protein C3F06_10575 [Candidatus Methanoperedenaceae archaeon]|nr:MAG: hypothetical protein C3F06_10575 [Candidatus Methanoperedenaceae archaeon]